jgi:putative iron-dependent peroxidase
VANEVVLGRHSARRRFVQSQPHGGGNLQRTAASAGGETPQCADRPPQAAEQPPALRAVAGVALHPRPPRASQIVVEECGHVAGRPPMIALEARPLHKSAHSLLRPRHDAKRFAHPQSQIGTMAVAMSPAEPQVIVTEPSAAAIFLVLTAASSAGAEIRDVLADVGAIRRSVGFRVPEAQLTCVVGIGSLVWDRLFSGPRPAGLHPLPEFRGSVHTAPSTPGDLLFHIRAQRTDLCFELAQRLTERLGEAASEIDEVHGFKSFDERDLLGFVDGTENPEGDSAREAVTVASEDPAFAGGSYVVVQKYLHDLAGWDALAVETQEQAIGRTKLSNIELPDEVKPDDSHVALTTIVDADGTEHDIMRFNMPFGMVGARQFGTYFIGYASRPDVLEQMLTNMFCGTDGGSHDRILDFSTAVTGNLFFVPTVDFLEDPPAPPSSGTASADADGSLGIGSLRPDR